MENLIEKYKSLNLEDILDYEKFNMISISHHSTRIEGSTLTEIETQVLINNGLTPKGKPLIHSLMLTDHYQALTFVLKEAQNKRPISFELIKEINAKVMKSTGNLYNTILGEVDASKGMLRKGNVSAGISYFPNYDKVEKLTNNLVELLNEKIGNNLSVDDQLNLSFDAHFNLVSIHPFYDGNGRTSRLLMNYIQAYYNLPLAIVNSENKQDYINTLVETRKNEDISIFRNFMQNEYKQFLSNEIDKYEKQINQKNSTGFSFLF
ncbi:Fic family protein [Flavobacterium branchiarum]|uniref:Fic family protein n=1 Tax=Flavobacterium branchiarum TaxID=1114870 RepID=A0ABV5FK68_9FLAO|nr:Fic family protein [Flavobacterium branchiarum]MDN3672375.1 Fic family protein [Flavobacterium branchiarum]